MQSSHSRLEVHSPDGRSFEVDLEPGQVQIGRSAPGHRPDVVLGPDPQRWVGRLHCLLDYSDGAWWLSDNGTVNGTFLCRAGHTERVSDRRRLHHQDVIRILGAMTESGELRYWDLTLTDPFATRQAPRPARPPTEVDAGTPDACLEYDWVQAKLFCRHGDDRREITGMSPLAHRLVRYMVERSQAGGRTEPTEPRDPSAAGSAARCCAAHSPVTTRSVACTHAELIQAVWGDGGQAPPGFTAEHLRDLVSDLRKRLEPDRARGQASRLLETVPGIGYRLVVCAGPDPV